MDTQDTMRAIGVYAIVNLTSGKLYIGSAAKSFANRWKSHKSMLRNGKHHSTHLQFAWNKYGETAFEFHILEVTAPEDAVAREQFWIDFHNSADPENGYNIAPNAGSQLGHKWTPEQCEAQRSRIKKVMSAPEAREAARARAKLQFSTAEARELLGTQMRAGITAESRERAKKANRTPEARKANSEQAKARNGTPESRRKASERTKKQFSTIESRKAASEYNKAHRGTPEARDEQRERAKAQFSTPEARKHQSEKTKAFFADPIRKAEWLAKFRATLAARKKSKRPYCQLELFS